MKANVWFRSLDHEIDHREKGVELEVEEGMLPELERGERRWTFSHTLTSPGPRGRDEEWLVYTERGPTVTQEVSTAPPQQP